uniref:Uncharacterized protein n=1 Tax=Panagrolaimus superbus TaxID=310955 RepID=A0A914YWR4_9BILA
MADIVSNPINREKMKILFHEAYSKWKSNKNECRLHVKRDELYDEIIESFRKKECGQQLTSTKEYNWIKRYECVWENDEAVLHHKGKIVVKESSLFNLLYDIHLQLGHRCRDGMVRRLKIIMTVFQKKLLLYL